MAMRGGHRSGHSQRTWQCLCERGGMQPTSHWSALREGGGPMRVVLVTGANGGLGQAIARSFLNESVENFVWLAVHKNKKAAIQLAEAFENRCGVLTLDVAERSEWDKAVQHIIEKSQRIDVLVNNAGRHQD